jgi:hypothetical protein
MPGLRRNASGLVTEDNKEKVEILAETFFLKLTNTDISDLIIG